jgi:hypothetical protein
VDYADPRAECVDRVSNIYLPTYLLNLDQSWWDSWTLTLDAQDSREGSH